MKRSMRIFVLALLAISLLSVTLPAMAQQTMWAIGQPDTFLRPTPSTSQPYIARVPYGAEVTRFSETYNEGEWWSQVAYGSRTGYMMSRYLSTTNPNPGSHPQTILQAFGSTNLQYGPYYNYCVKNVQLCVGVTADGYFGTNTRDAVITYQSNNGLNPDGVVGPLTKEKLWDQYKTYLQNNGFMQ